MYRPTEIKLGGRTYDQALDDALNMAKLTGHAFAVIYLRDRMGMGATFASKPYDGVVWAGDEVMSIVDSKGYVSEWIMAELAEAAEVA